ncbi:MAG: helix-turn-helix transcriptional regulator [Betaproteobacteria bacterium]|nr:helix-turn-helix transcriptional regulator [Betaproteobacteria bacterium]
MPRKAHTSALVAALKSALKSQGITYRTLADRLKLSEASVKRLFAEESFTLRRMEEICVVLGVDFFELARIARGSSAETDEMTLKQEETLAADPRLLGLFYLLFNDWKVEAVLEVYDLQRAECTLLLAHLEKAGLLEIGANDVVRLKVPKSLRLRRDGPIRRSHGRSVVADFLQADFAAQQGFFRFEFRELSPASVAHLERKLERIAQEFHELAELDSYLPPERRRTTGLVVGMRPWAMSWVTGLKRRDEAHSAERKSAKATQ